jgi:hypothetical protein
MHPRRYDRSIFGKAVRLGLLAVMPILGACSGSIGDAPDFSWGRGPGGTTTAGGTGTGGGITVGAGYAPLVAAEAPMRRLTQQQYKNTIADIFGADIKLNLPLEDDESTAMFMSIGASRVGTSDRGVEQYHDAAFDIATQVLQHAANYESLAKCSPQTSSDPCIGTFVKTFGQKLWRRPLSSDELSRYTAIAGAAGSDAASLQLGMKYVLATMLQSPNFLYLVQTGEPDVAQGGQRFTSYEMASRLSYFLWDSTPDQSLLDAAGRNDLVTADGISTQARRMAADPRAREMAGRFLSENWNISKLTPQSKSLDTFPKWTPALFDQYMKEFSTAVADKVFTENGDFRDFFVGKGATAASAGLLTSGAVLAANSPADRSSPTRRGVLVRERMLCLPVPPPPPNVNTALVANPQDKTGKTIRQLLEEHRTNPVCAACHSSFDPLGLTLEHFDGIGQYRDTENGQPIDSTGGYEGKTLTSARELGDALKGDPLTSRCMAQQLYGFATGHEPTDGEEGVIEALGDKLSVDFKIQNLIVELVASAGFRYLAAQ